MLGAASVDATAAVGVCVTEFVAAIGGATSPPIKNQTPIPSIATMPTAIAISGFDIEGFAAVLLRIGSGYGELYVELIDARPC